MNSLINTDKQAIIEGWLSLMNSLTLIHTDKQAGPTAPGGVRHTDSQGFTGTHRNSQGLARTHRDSQGLSGTHWDTHTSERPTGPGLTGFKHTDSQGFTDTHMDSQGLARTHRDSQGLAGTHRDSPRLTGFTAHTLTHTDSH